jgi:outer membrane protein OmpA-like peptidoglycan-associated protein
MSLIAKLGLAQPLANLGAKAVAPSKGVESHGHKEQSWIRPSASVASAPVHVATIYFATKDSSVGGFENDLLKKLAQAYAPYARRNVGKKGADQGLSGRVEGYADPRLSVEPNNKLLSEQRATHVARALTRHLVLESQLIVGDFRIEAGGGGVLQIGEDEAAKAEGNQLAPMRRADVYLSGGVVAVDATPLPSKDQPKDEPPPPLKELPTEGFPRFDRAIEDYDKEAIWDNAIQMVVALGVGAASRRGSASQNDVLGFYETAIELRLGFVHKARRAEFPREIKPIKPSWWDGIAARIPRSQGRNAERNTLVFKARLLKKQYLLAQQYYMTYIDPDGVLARALKEVEKDSPDPKKVHEYYRVAGYYRFMHTATADLANEVQRLAKK